MSPSRRGCCTEVTGSKLFPLSFCTVRWVENSRVSKRALEKLPAIKTYVESIKGTDREPSSNSFKTIESSLNDKLLPAKLAFFQTFSEQLEPFLTEFQTDSPMVPFLYDDLVELMRQVMARFVSKNCMEKEDFFSTDVTEKEDGLFKNLMKVKEIDLGYGTRSSLRQCKDLKGRDMLGFRKDVRSCYQNFVAKVQERSPLKYPLTKAFSFLNPSNITTSRQENNFQKMSQALDILIESNLISAARPERADREFKEIISKESFKFKCNNFNRKETRLDEFWNYSLEVGCENLKEVVKKVLILSHGNATLERGFSINKTMLVENLKEESLIAQRIIFDAITDVGGMDSFSSNPIPKKLVHSMRNAYSRFKEAEAYRQEKMSEKDKRAADKRKTSFQVKELEEKKRKLMEEALQKAEELAQEIEAIKRNA